MKHIKHDIKINNIEININCLFYNKNEGEMSIKVVGIKSGYEYYNRECNYYKTIRDIVNAIIRLKKSKHKMTEKRLKNWCDAV